MSSEHDKAILNAIFNPLLPTEYTPDEQLDNLHDIEDDTDYVRSAKALEIEGVKMAESGNLDKALITITQAIQCAPERPSGYNNRAQVHRLKGNVEEAMKDLNSAIALSDGSGRSGCQALCQRGLIHWKNGDNEKARSDFEEASKLGSQFAKTQLVKLNPYAALCNQMLYNAFNSLNS